MAMDIAPAKEIITNILESQADFSPEVEDFLESLQEEGYVNPFFVFIGLFFSLIINSIFGLIGGIIGAAIFRKRGQTDTPDTAETS